MGVHVSRIGGDPASYGMTGRWDDMFEPMFWLDNEDDVRAAEKYKWNALCGGTFVYSPSECLDFARLIELTSDKQHPHALGLAPFLRDCAVHGGANAV